MLSTLASLDPRAHPPSPLPRLDLQSLRDRILAIEAGTTGSLELAATPQNYSAHGTHHRHGEPLDAPATHEDGFARVALTHGVVQEWFGTGDGRSTDWHPPVALLMGISRRVAAQSSGLVAWIGRACWANPVAIALADARSGSRRLLTCSLFIDARDVNERAWAIDQALRSSAICCVIGDASGLDMAMTRRLQLSAASGRSVALLARTVHELRVLSAAHARWRVRTLRSESSDPRWSVELLRCKGLRPVEEDARRWVVRLDHGTGDVGVVPDAGYRVAQAQARQGQSQARSA